MRLAHRRRQGAHGCGAITADTWRRRRFPSRTTRSARWPGANSGRLGPPSGNRTQLAVTAGMRVGSYEILTPRRGRNERAWMADLSRQSLTRIIAFPNAAAAGVMWLADGLRLAYSREFIS